MITAYSLLKTVWLNVLLERERERLKWWYTWKRAISAPNFFLSKWIPANKNDESFAMVMVPWVCSCSCHRRSLVAADLSTFPSTLLLLLLPVDSKPKSCSGHNNPDLLGLTPTKNWISFQYSLGFFSTPPFALGPWSLCRWFDFLKSFFIIKYCLFYLVKKIVFFKGINVNLNSLFCFVHARW